MEPTGKSKEGRGLRSTRSSLSPDRARNQMSRKAASKTDGREPGTRPFQRANDDLVMILDCMPDAILIVNPRGQIQWANQQAERMFGYVSKDMVDKPVEILIADRLTRHPE